MESIFSVAMVNWCALPDGVIVSISRRLQHVKDFLSFRGTCNSWRSVTNLKDFDRSYPKLPLLMLIPMKCTENGSDRMIASEEREFFSLSDKKITKIWLPEAKGKNCIGSQGGWLIMYEKSSSDMNLLHSFTRSYIPLPHAPIQLEADFDDFYDCDRAILSASPSETLDYVIIILFREDNLSLGTYIGFWKPNDSTWTKVETPTHDGYLNPKVSDISFYNGKCYALLDCEVWVCDVLGPEPKKLIKIIQLPTQYLFGKRVYFVACDDRLLVVTSYFKIGQDVGLFRRFEIVELDVIGGTFTKIKSLGNTTSVFLGENAGFSVDAMKFQGIVKPNHIYFGNGRHQEPGRDHSETFYSASDHSIIIRGAWVTPNL